MSKNPSKRNNASQSRADRFSQMSKQEEIIAEKKRLIEAKLKMMEAQSNAAPTTTTNKTEVPGKPALVNSFSNDGSFLEKFKKISSSTLNDTTTAKANTERKQNKSFNNNTSRSNNYSRWNNKNDRGFRNQDHRDSYNDQESSIGNTHQDTYNNMYDSNFQDNNYANRMHGNMNMPINNGSNQSYQNSCQDSYINTKNVINPPQQFPVFSNNMNNINWNNSALSQPPPPVGQTHVIPPGLSVMSQAPPGLTPPSVISQPPPIMSQPPPAMTQPPPVIPSLTSLVIPPPSGIQINSSNTQVPPPPIQTNVQVPPPIIQTNVQVPPPNAISLQSIPEPQPLETMTIPRPAPLNLLSIPPPLPLCLNQIPPPKDIDVRNIPPPKQMNIAGIQMPCIDNAGIISVLSTDEQTSQGSKDQSDMKQLKQQNPDCNPIERVAKLVVEIGEGYEEIFKQKHQHEPEFWFLFHQDSAEYSEYRMLVKKLKEDKTNQCYSPEELYEPEFSLNDEDEEAEHDVKVKIEKSESPPKAELRSLVSSCYDDVNDQNISNSNIKMKIEKNEPNESEENQKKRKRKSRWGSEKDIKPVIPAPGIVQVPSLGIALPSNVAPLTIPVPHIPINKVTRTDKALLQYAKNTFGTTDLSEEDWIKAEDHFKINLLYQEMLKKRKELDQLSRSGRHKYEYDSDEEVEGGTWEHKLRSQEMEATQKWAEELTKKSEGKHHIGDFLPPEELKKFMEKYSAAKNGREPDISDYKEYKLNEKNVGFQMLQKLGWKDGEGLGTNNSGIVEPINKAPNHENNQGLGIERPDNVQTDDNEYDAYRKRMMLAYRFRPNPLNNPRRPYY